MDWLYIFSSPLKPITWYPNLTATLHLQLVQALEICRELGRGGNSFIEDGVCGYAYLDIMATITPSVRTINNRYITDADIPSSVFCTGCGFGIAKADIFPAVAVAGAGQMLLNITLPCQMFSKIVPSFSTQNISALGKFIQSI